MPWFLSARPQKRSERRCPFAGRVRPSFEILEDRAVPAGIITGRAFLDFNANGIFDTTASAANASGLGGYGLAVDQGVGGITVVAFDAANVLRGTAITAADGTYTLNATGIGPYRIQFSLPPGSPLGPGPHGPQNNTAVQFVPDGNSSGINFAVFRPDWYAANNSTLFTNCYVFGDQVNGPNRDLPVLVDFPLNAGSNSTTNASSYAIPTTHSLMIPARLVGTTGGLGYRAQTGTIYAAAAFKKHAGFGPAGTGAIYAVNRATGAVSLFADLNAIFGAGTAGADLHDPSDYDTDNFNIGWDAVGKSSLGGLDVSPDGRTVYVMNLADRSLYALPTSGPLTPATVQRTQIPLNAPGATGVNGADLRPYAVQWFNGRVYVGIVNSAESTQNAADLRAYVYEVDPTTLTFSAAPVFQMALNYPRGQVLSGTPAAWNPWSPTFASLAPPPVGGEGPLAYPQPMLTSLAFDPDGNLVLGFRDRLGDQGGTRVPADPGSPLTLYTAIPAGDVVRAFINIPGNLSGGWTLENNGRGPSGQGAGPTGTGQGPGGGEFYHRDESPFSLLFPNTAAGNLHDEVSLGAVLQIPGFPDVIESVYNPAMVSDVVASGGFRWFDNATGGFTKGYELYAGNAPLFGKAAGIGDVIALDVAAPLEVGNRVWLDSNQNGRQDPDEPILAGVTVRLYSPAGVLLASAVTDANGAYYFNSGPGTSTPSAIFNVTGLQPDTSGYTIRLDNPADYAPGGPLFQLIPTITTVGGGIGSVGVLVGGFARTTFNTGDLGFVDHTLDFGFFQQPLANIAVTKTPNVPQLFVGQLVTYTFTVRNVGNTTATNVVMTDVLPPGLSFVSASSPSQGSYNPAINRWTIGTLNAGQVVTLQVTYRVTRAGFLVNTATVTMDQTDTDPSNNTSQARVRSFLPPPLISKRLFLASQLRR